MSRVDISEGGLMWKAGMDLSYLEQDLSTMQRMISQASTRAIEDGNKMTRVFENAAKAAAAYFSLQQSKQLISDIIKVRGEFQQLEIAFTTMLQSKVRADELMRQSVELAKTTPFTLDQVAQGAKQLLAYGTQAEDVTKTITMLGNVASGVSAPLNDIVYLYGTLQTQGRAYAVDIRQFAGRGIPIYEELAKVMGVGKDEISGLVEAGKVGFPQVELAFKNMTSEGGLFFNLMQEQSKSLTGQISNLQDKISLMFNEIGKGNQGLLSSGIEGAAFLVEHYKQIGNILGILISTYGAYKIAIALVNAGEANKAKTLATQSALLGQRVRDELLAVNLIRDRSIALQQQAIAEANAAKAKVESLRVDVVQAAATRSRLLTLALEKRALQQQAATQVVTAQQELAAIAATGTARQVQTAQRKVDIATKKLANATDSSSIATQNALAASSSFYTTKKNLETAAIEVNVAVKKVATATNEAMVATENAATVASTRLTLAQHAQALATALTQKAQALLNATMLDNPIVATIAIIGGLVAAYFILRDSATEAEKAQKRLNDALKDASEQTVDQKVKVQDLVKEIKNETLTNEQRMAALSRLKDITNGRLDQLTLEAFKTGEATKAIDEYVAALDREAKAKAYQDTKIFNYKRIQQIDKEISDNAKVVDNSLIGVLTYSSQKNIDLRNKILNDEKTALQNQNKDIDQAQKIELQEQAKRDQNRNKITTHNKKYYEDLKKDAQAQLEALDIVRAKGSEGKKLLKQIADYDKILEAYDQPKKQKAADRKSFLADKAFSDIQQKISDSRFKYEIEFSTNADSKNREINNYFDELKEDVAEYNKDPKNKLHLLDEKKANEQIEAFRRQALGIADYKNDTDKLNEQLNLAKKEYEEYEDFKEKYGQQAADSLYKGLVAKHKSYVDRLLAEKADIEAIGGLNASQNARLQKIDELLVQANADALKRSRERVEIETKMYLDLLQKAGNYKVQSELLEKERNARLAALERDRTTIGEEEYKRRFDIINGAYKKGIKELSIFESDLFKKLNNDIETGSKSQIQSVIDDLDKALSTGKIKDATGKIVDVPPDVLLRLKSAREQLKGLLNEVNELAFSESKLGKVGKVIGEIGSGLSGIGQSLQSAGNSGLGEVLSNMGAFLQDLEQAYRKIGTLVKALSDSGKDLKQVFKSTDWVGLIVSLINLISGFFGSAKRYKEALEEAQRAVDANNADILLGEYKITEEMREQNRLQAESIELTRRQLAERKKVGEESKRQILDETASLLKQIQDGERIYYRYVDRPGGLNKLFGGKPKEMIQYGGLGSYKVDDFVAYMKSAGYTDKFLNDLVSKYGKDGMISRAALDDLEGKGLFGQNNSKAIKDYHSALTRLDADGKKIAVTWKELKDLNAQGLLDGATKSTFDQLAELEKQGVDVDNVLKNIKREIDELNTATTTSAISDAIVNGFRDGKRSAADFAGDFETMMRNAMLNSLRYDEEAEKRVKEWYDQFAAAAADGVIDATEKDLLKNGWDELIKKGDERAKLLEESTGISLTDKSKSSSNRNNLEGAFSSASQESITLLASYTNGARVAQLTTNNLLKTGFVSLNDIANRSLDNLQKIERNTYNTVEELRKSAVFLKSMDSKMGDAANKNRLTGQ